MEIRRVLLVDDDALDSTGRLHASALAKDWFPRSREARTTYSVLVLGRGDLPEGLEMQVRLTLPDGTQKTRDARMEHGMSGRLNWALSVAVPVDEVVGHIGVHRLEVVLPDGSTDWFEYVVGNQPRR